MNWKKIKRHPLSAVYDNLEGPVWDRFIENFKAHGNAGRKIVLHEKQILDGFQLYRAHVECNVKPQFKPLPKGWAAEEYVEMVNDLRRHESKERAAKRIADRRERVAKLRADGASTRTIAEAEGVSEATVRSDLSGAQGCAPDIVKGQDGKNYSAKPMCERCKRCARVGKAVPDRCPECTDLRRTKRAEPRKSPSNGEPETKTDAFRNILPPRCRDAYCDPWIQDSFDLLTTINGTLLKARLADGMHKRAKRYPFFIAQDFIDGVGFVTDYLDKLIDHLKANRPAGVCPSCAGKGCGDCRMSGLVPRNLYGELKK